MPDEHGFHVGRKLLDEPRVNIKPVGWPKGRPRKGRDISTLTAPTFAPAEELNQQEAAELGAHLQLSEPAKKFAALRAQGFSPVEAVRELDRLNPPVDHKNRPYQRSATAERRLASDLDKETQLYQITITGVDNFSDVQFRAFANAIRMQIAQHPSPNAGASLAALREMEKIREAERFGTREAVLKTKQECEARLKELMGIEAWGKEHGVAGAGLDATESGDQRGPEEGDLGTHASGN